MTQPRTMDADTLHGMHVMDSAGGKIGKVSGIYLDVENGKPEWAAVKTGAFGTHETLVPLVNATVTGEEMTVPYTKEMVKSAPHYDPARELSNDEEAELFTHYGVPYVGETVTAQAGGQPTPPAPTSASRGVQDTSGANTDDAMTRSEERVTVGKQTVVAGKARLVKHIVTETVTQTVPVSHEEVRVAREPITKANRGAAMRGADLTEEEAEITLHGEKVVVNKETVPVERVKLATQAVTEQQQVSEQVRKEVIETEGVTSTDAAPKRP